MLVLQRLTHRSDAELRQLETNARERVNGPLREDAEAVLKAVSGERQRRDQQRTLTAAAEQARIREAMAGLPFKERVAAAFKALPPLDWEAAALRALADNPGATTEELSHALGYSGTYMNWFGHVCRDREAWLGPVQPGPDGEIVYSSLLVDFETTEREGRLVTTWRLKSEVREALVECGVLRRDD